MKFLVFLLILAGGFFGAPLLLESSSDECSAFSARAVSLITASQGNQDVFSTIITAGIAQVFVNVVLTNDLLTQYPSVPPAISCSALYWQSLYDPQFVVDVWNQSQSKTK